MSRIITARHSYRTSDSPWAYFSEGIRDGAYELSSGQRKAGGQYSKSPWSYACMQIRGTEMAGLPWRLTRNGEEVESHPIIDLLSNFGLEGNWADGVTGTEINMCMLGAGYWLIDGDTLQRLPASTIRVEHDRSGIQAFVQHIDGRDVNSFRRDEVVYFREFNPDDDLAPGVPVVETVKHSIEVEYQMNLMVKAFIMNDATPAIHLTTEQTVSEPEAKKIKDWWKSRFGGPRKKGEIAVSDKGLKATPISSSLKDAAFVEIRDQARSDICVGFRVPKILVGSMEAATYANAQEARKFMIEDLIVPRSDYYASVINADLVERIDPSVVFEFQPEELPLMKEDEDSKWMRLGAAVEKGVISPEFARQEMGWPDDAAPDEPPAPPLAEPDPTLRSWKRKAVKAYKRGDNPDVPFETDEIAPEMQRRIHVRLARAADEQAVVRAFLDD